MQKKVKHALGGKEPTISNLFELIFGPRSSIGRKIEAKLEISNEDFCKHLGTYSLAAAYNLVTQIFSKQSFINLEGLTDEKDYQSFWDTIEEIGCQKTTNIRSLRPLWIDVQSALNETCRKLFIEGYEGYMRVTIDDDKMHHQTGKGKDTQGLKVTQHVRDNQKGFVTHTCCYTASGLTIGIE